MDTAEAVVSTPEEALTSADEPWQDIGLRIRQARELRKLTRRDLATELGVTEGAVQQWEDGRGVPELRRLGPIVMNLDVSCDWLVFGAGRPPRPVTSEEEQAVRLLRRLPEDERRAAINLLMRMTGARAPRRRAKAPK